MAFPLLLAALLAAPSAAEPLAGRETWTVEDLRTSIAFRHDRLAALGLAVEDVEATGSPLEHHPTSVSQGRDLVFTGALSPSLELEVVGHAPRRFLGTVMHRGGFTLAGEAGAISFAPFSLRSGERERTVELLSAGGEVIFYADFMHFELERDLGRLRSFNLDLRVAPALAERLGAPSLAGVFVGTLAIEASFPPPAEDPARGGCVPDWTGEVDVQLTSIGNVDSVLEQGGVVGITPSAELKNVGTADVPWWRKFTGPFEPYDNDQHPYLTWAFYRLSDDRIEQLGVSDIKHAFLTINVNCTPSSEGCNSHILGLGCEDVYGSSTNDSRSHLSYRDEIEAHAGLWNGVGSHFDPDDDGTQEHPPQFPDGVFAHRLLVDEDELTTPGAQYFMHAFYLIRDDVDIFNSMAYRQVAPSSGSFGWSFPTVGGTKNGSVLDLWIDPANPPADAANVVVETASGTLQLAARASALGAASTRFEYALLNHDFGPQVDVFAVPLGGQTPSDITFRDLDDDPTNDWQATLVGDRLEWRLPSGAQGSPAHTGGVALDWGLMYNFGFTIAVGSATLGSVELERYEGSGSVPVASVVPEGDSALIFSDGFESGDLTAWGPSLRPSVPAGASNDG